MDIKTALDLWISITGVNPEDKYKVITLENMTIETVNNILTQSLKYDQTYVTTIMLLKVYLNRLLEERKITFKTIIEDYDQFQKLLSKINELERILSSQTASEIKSQFKELLKAGLKHYGINQSVYDLMIANEENLAELRYSAFNAVNELTAYTFLEGKPTTAKPKIYKDILAFRDINALLEWMTGAPSGIVLALIQDLEHPSSSYFAFAIHNGGTLSIVTDKTRDVHPLYDSMSRKRATGRRFYERITAYHFPYSVMDISFGDNQRAYISQDESALMTITEGAAIRAINQLEPNESVWLMMMFDLIEQKYFKTPFKAKSLTYTAKMITEKKALLSRAEEHHLAINTYQPLAVTPITNLTLRAKNLKKVFETEPTGKNDWLIDYFDVPDLAYDVTGEADTLLAKPNDTFWEHDRPSKPLKNMSLSSFGSASQLESDRLYLARYNQAMVINDRLEEEHKQQASDIHHWLEQAIRKNLPTLFKAIAHGKFLVTGDKDKSIIRMNDGWYRENTSGNILSVKSAKSVSNYWTPIGTIMIGGKSSSFYQYPFQPTCTVNDTQPTIVGHFSPQTVQHLVDLCGCSISNMPVMLQHWKAEDRDYNGNPILDCLDPMDWAVENPFNKDIDIVIYFSKRAFNKLCKDYQTGNEQFWLNKPSNDEGVTML